MASITSPDLTAQVPSKTKPSPSPHLTYRPDIDGLRAVAVVSVVLFHLNLLRGGFVGVDVFFVISGFLITSLLWKEVHQTGSISLTSFYERRIRRIFPALIAMFAVTWVVGYKYLFPFEFVDYARSLLAALLSVANIFFWRESGYFAAPASAKPLLHTWSLGVEEQFYLLFPPLLAFLFRAVPKHLKTIVWVLAAVSFAACVVMTRLAPDAAFYLPVTRAWELLLGSQLAIHDLPLLHRRAWRNLAAGAGLLMLCFTLLRFSSATPFPGYLALLPSVAATLLIAAGKYGTHPIGKALSWKPFVFVGLVSYSLYLWHWPLIVFAQHGMPIRFGLPSSKYTILPLSFLLAVLSWRFVERPFRRSRKAAHVFSGAALAIAAISALACVTLFTGGFVTRFAPRVLEIAAFGDQTTDATHQTYRVGSCFLTSGNTFGDFRPDPCLVLDPVRTNVLLLGDSHAAMLYKGLQDAFPEVHFLQATASGCLPLAESGQRHNARGACTQLVSYMLNQWLPVHHVANVLIAANWQSPEDIRNMGGTIRYLRGLGLSPVLIGPPPEYDAPLPTLVALSIQQGNPSLVTQHRLGKMQGIESYSEQITSNIWHIPYLSIYRTLCTQKDCLTLFPDDVPVQSDADHLSVPASDFVAASWRTAHAEPWR